MILRPIDKNILFYGFASALGGLILDANIGEALLFRLVMIIFLCSAEQFT